MTYKQNFVAVVKVNGKILREYDDVVSIPFGSEYSILLKNLESRKVYVTIEVDGKDVLSGRTLIIDPNSSKEIERFLENNLNEGSKFKFIQKTKQISEYRGDRVEDGIVRIEYTFEKKSTWIPSPWLLNNNATYTCNNNPWRVDNSYKGLDNFTNQVYCCSIGADGVASSNTLGFTSSISSSGQILNENCLNRNIDNAPKQEEGITVKGRESNQKFYNAYDYSPREDISNVITFKLKGITDDNKVVDRPIIVTDRIKCETCGTVSRSDKKFCSNCGTRIICI